MEVVDDPKDIILDVVMCSGADFENVESKDYTTISVGKRAFEIMSYQKSMGYLERARLNHPDIQMRYTVVPLDPLEHEPLPVTFTHTERMLKQGLQDAFKVVSMGEGKMHDELLGHWVTHGPHSINKPKTFGSYLEDTVAQCSQESY